jgi:hypothetical protein
VDFIMRLILPLLLCLSSSILAAPTALLPQDAINMERVLLDISIAVQRLDSTVSRYARNPSDRPDFQQRQVNDDNSALTNAFSQGASRIRSEPVARHVEIKLAQAINNLNGQIQTTIGGTYVLARRVILDAGGQRPIVDLLRMQQAAATDFTRTLVAKLPVQDVMGVMLQRTIYTEYDKAIRMIG